jgi:tetratricopeptide (TPR) repeat protein
VLTHSEADLVTLDTQFRRKVAAEDVNGYEMEIQRHPDDAGLHDSVALLCLEIGRAEPAIAHFRKSLAIKGPSAPAHYNLGTALTLARKLDEAVDEYKQALQIDPAYAPAHNNLGNVWLAQGQVDAAIREFREVVRLQPDSAAAKANLAAALLHKSPPR